MLSDVAKEVGVVLRMNTSARFSGPDQRAYDASFGALWAWAESSRAAGGTR
jgi:hypothetical protein